MSQLLIVDRRRARLVAAELDRRRRAVRDLELPGRSVVLVHMLQQVQPDIPVLFLDTVHHFALTLAYRDEMAKKWGLNLITLPRRDAGAGAVAAGPQGVLRHATRWSRCSARSSSYDTWFTGLRREQSPSRAALEEIEPFTLPTGKVLRKVSPLALWRTKEVWAYAQATRDPAAAALRPRLHEHRLRAVHDASARPVQRALRPLGRARSSNAGSICRRSSELRLAAAAQDLTGGSEAGGATRAS